ncbi:nucleotidyltransferase domain-containing protein [Candidatus Methanodesulfokora washburnensis]|jgi:predicted nucleotidyltransferase|uniref:Nucleotidyltransferase domain-containing protein n=1 Tax=Candidatus Methanodesulfokora washburnensis TaxID=2478471 RepID=A0A429GNF4_9CREN|nr:nucleotidyltransferase domain-containing protein [Candidatus Methanodesulfokores washburnensis]RSN75394.1 nucleotidyltransferase domain-containing protein [Candidatus Methanodesulfokores washburnensis]
MGCVRKILRIDIGKIWDGRPAIEHLANYIEQLSKLTNVRAVVVIGSRASGTWKLSSDIDAIVVVDKAVSYTELPPPGVVDPRIYTVKELFEAINAAEYELIEAFEEGKVVYDDGIWKEMLKTYEEVKERLKIRRYKKGWRIHAEAKT